MKSLILLLLNILLLTNVSFAEDKLELKDEKDKISYSIGYQVGGDFREQQIELNEAALLQGLHDAINSSETLIAKDEMNALLVELKKKIDALTIQKQINRRENYRGEGRSFLAENAKKEGVISLPSGLQYQVLKNGNGKMPKPEDTVTVAYRGTLINGKEFDSSFRDNKPATFRIDTVIPGWREALPMMKEGAKWKLFIPSDLAFGEKGPLADKVVIYEIELLSVLPTQK